MTPLQLFFVALLVVSLTGLLVAEHRASVGHQWIAKPIASTAFIGLALASGASATVYGRWIITAQICCWLGDLLLIPDQRNTFLAGLASFLLGHLAFATAFALQELDWSATGRTALLMAAVAVLVFLWLRVHLSRSLTVAVGAYLIAISIMVVTASGTLRWWLIVGAALFAVSDLFVARQRFIRRSFTNRLVGLPLYYASQVIFAITASGG